MVVRPRLRPGLRRVWRDPTSLQVGLHPGAGVVLIGVQAGDEAVIAALDGSHELAQLREVAARHGLARRRVDELLQLLEDANLLHPVEEAQRADRVHLGQIGLDTRTRLAPDTDAWSLVHDVDGARLAAARSRRRVDIEGGGRLGAVLRTTLVEAGVGAVRVLSARAVDDVATGPPCAPAGSSPDVVVLIGSDVLDARVGDELVRRDLVHLAVVVGADRVVVGPLVRPGSSPCLRCLDLHRRDRDPGWLHVVAQLLTALRRKEVGETALCTAGAGLAALQVLNELDGQLAPDAEGRTLEISLPQRRTWRWHDSCGCARLPTESASGHRRPFDQREATMDS